MLPISLTVGPLAAAVSNNIALSQTPTSGTALTLNGATVTGGVATLDAARRVLLSYGSEASPRTLRITGTNADGNPIRETLAVPSGASGTVYTGQDFLTVTEALPAGGGWSAAATLGTNTIASSPWKLTNSMQQAVTEIAWDGHVAAGTGVGRWSVEYTLSTINSNQNQMGGALGNYPAAPIARTLTALSSQAGDAQAAQDNPIMAWRLVIDDGGDTTFMVTIIALEGGIAESH